MADIGTPPVEWEFSSELTRLLRIQATRRRDHMIREARTARERLANRAAADGTLRSGGFVTTVNGAVFSLFREYANGLLADCLGFADDLQWNPDASEWLHERYREEIEITAKSDGFREVLPREQDERVLEDGINRLAHDATMEGEIAFGRVRLRREAAAPRPGDANVAEREHRDCFISHAGEDGAEVAQPLAEELRRRGRSVWFSGFELTIGDSLRKKIDDGLRLCRYGVVILSPHFFEKPWPEAELNALHARTMNEGRKVILPVWHNVTKDDISKRSPLLSDLLAVSTSKGLGTVADEIIRALDAGN